MAGHAHTMPARRPATPSGRAGRRSLSTGAAALALAGAGGSLAASAALAMSHPDEALIRLGEHFVRQVGAEVAA